MPNLPRPLNSLIPAIQREHEQACSSLRTAVKHAVACGALLEEATSQLPHGERGAWITQHFPGSIRTAQAWQRMAKHKNLIEASGETGVSAAMQAVSKESVVAGKCATVARLDAPNRSGETETQVSDDGTDDTEGGWEPVEPESEPEPTPDPDSLDAVQGDIRELISDVKALAAKARRVFRAEKQELTRPWTKQYSWPGVIGTLNEYARMLDSSMPMGGTPKNPVSNHTLKAQKARGE